MSKRWLFWIDRFFLIFGMYNDSNDSNARYVSCIGRSILSPTFASHYTLTHIHCTISLERMYCKMKLIFFSLLLSLTIFLISSLILILLLKAINFINERLNNENALHLAAFILELYVRNLCQKRFLYSQQASPQNWKFNIIYTKLFYYLCLYSILCVWI